MIILLTRGKKVTVAPELARLGDVTTVKAPVPPDAAKSNPRTNGPLWADRSLNEIAELVATGDVEAIVNADERTAPFAWRLAERFPDTAVLNGQLLAARVLGELRERGTPVSTATVRELLDGLRRPWPLSPGYFTDPSQRPPLVVSLVNNTVEVDSRVQKVARSLADLGYDSVLIGRSPRTEPQGDWYLLGSAVVLRPEVTTGRLNAQRADPPPAGSLDAILGAPHPTGAWNGGRIARRLEDIRRRRRDRSVSSFREGSAEDSAHRTTIRAVQEGRVAPGRAYPAVLDWSDAFVPLLAELRPDAIHIHDPVLIPAAVRARDLLARAGHPVPLVYDAHEWTLGTARDHALQVPALARLESEHMADMSAVITVSQPISQLMTTHFGLTDPPAVVTNSPVARPIRADEPDVRSDLGLPADTPLAIYTGSVAEARGLELALNAIQRLPDVHLVLLSRNLKPTRDILRRARELGIRKRVHRLDYVPADDVAAYLRTADVGLIPFQSHVNSEMGLPTKFREYLQAGLPIVCTDIGLSGSEVVRTGVGEVAPQDSAKKFAKAIAAVLADPERYRSHITPELAAEHSWQEQVHTLGRVYQEVLGVPPTSAADRRVVIGALNSAGQAAAWASALTRHGVAARAIELRTPENPFQYDADRVIPRRSAETLQRRMQVLLRELLPADAVILESGQAVAAPEPGDPGGRRTGFREAHALAASGRRVGLMFHGSDLRRPDLHARTHEWSPFRSPHFAEVTTELRKRTRWNHEQLASWDGPVMVSTPDLIRQNPAAVWVPVVVDVDRFAPGTATTAGPPVVLHVPSKSMMKGSHYIDPVLQELADQGVIRYRRVTSVPHHRIPDLLRSSDIFVDQLGMGILGVAAVEAMACGVPVVTDPGPEALTAYGTEVPVTTATPVNLADVIVGLIADVDRRLALAEMGPDFAREFHDGRRSAEAISTAMGLPGIV